MVVVAAAAVVAVDVAVAVAVCPRAWELKHVGEKNACPQNTKTGISGLLDKVTAISFGVLLAVAGEVPPLIL